MEILLSFTETGFTIYFLFYPPVAVIKKKISCERNVKVKYSGTNIYAKKKYISNREIGTKCLKIQTTWKATYSGRRQKYNEVSVLFSVGITV